MTLTRGTGATLPMCHGCSSSCLTSLDCTAFYHFITPDSNITDVFADRCLVCCVRRRLCNDVSVPLRCTARSVTASSRRFIIGGSGTCVVVMPGDHPARIAFGVIDSHLKRGYGTPVRLVRFPTMLSLIGKGGFCHVSLKAVNSGCVVRLRATMK